MSFRLSQLAKNSKNPSAVNELTAGFANNFREKVDINLGVGYVNDRTIPVPEILEAYQAVTKDSLKYRNALNYGGAAGSSCLQESIKEFYLRNNIGQLTKKQWKDKKVLIGANGATSILDAISDLLAPGVVITSDPFYYIYIETLKNKGFKIIALPEDSDGIKPKDLANTVNSFGVAKVSFIYLATVNNPSATILSNSRRKLIVDIVNKVYEKSDILIPIVFDKAYEELIHNTKIERPVSGLVYSKYNNIFEIGTLSKIIAPALRIGYVICDDNELVPLLTQRTSDTGFSASLINQEIASWLLDNTIEQQLQKVNKGYAEKALTERKKYNIERFAATRIGDALLRLNLQGIIYTRTSYNFDVEKNESMLLAGSQITFIKEFEVVYEKIRGKATRLKIKFKPDEKTIINNVKSFTFTNYNLLGKLRQKEGLDFLHLHFSYVLKT